MLRTFDEVKKMIENGKALHIAGSEQLLRQLPKGTWVGGSTEYFMTAGGGVVSNDCLYATEFAGTEYIIKTYTAKTIQNVTVDAYDNGYSVVIIPFESEIHRLYSHNAADFDGMFIKNIVGWVTGFNLNSKDQTPISVNGQTGEVLKNEAAVIHIKIPDDKIVNIGIVNIFEQNNEMPVVEFEKSGFTVEKCRIDGREMVFAEYIAENNIDTRLPLVGDYSGVGVNISVKAIENGTVSFYAPVFKGIKYRIAKHVDNYAESFDNMVKTFAEEQPLFSCNCILNFLYGELEGKRIEKFYGPVTFGEIAYQLVNQTLVYVTAV